MTTYGGACDVLRCLWVDGEHWVVVVMVESVVGVTGEAGYAGRVMGDDNVTCPDPRYHPTL